MPGTRPGNAAYDGAEGVPTLTEVLAMVGAESVRRGRPVGVALELKHAAHHDAAGLPLDVPLLRELARQGLDHPWARVTLMSFEAHRPPTAGRADPAARRAAARPRARRDPRRARPHRRVRRRDRRAPVARAAPGRRRSDRRAVLPRPRRPPSRPHRPCLDACARENRFLPTNLRRADGPDALGDLAGEVRALLDAGVDGVITDHPEEALSVVREQAATAVG